MRELGVRMALGATPHGVFASVLRDALGLTGGGAAVGLTAALFAIRLLGHEVFGLGAPHWSAFVLAPALMLAVAVGAVWAPARRAATVDPLTVIREI
jgi:ABC-type antimicrobial peptide transport system permease subunit